MSNLNDTFKNIDEALGIEYEPEEVNEKSIVKVEENIPNVIEKIDDKGYMELPDIDYLTNEFKVLVSNTKKVLEKLDDDIGVGSEARKFEVYSDLVNSVNNSLKELRQTQEAAIRLKIDQRKANKDISNMGSGEKIMLTSDQILELTNKAAEKNLMNAIDVDYTIEDAKIEGNPEM